MAVLCAHLAAVDPRFAQVGRRAEDRQFQRRLALEAAGLDLPTPDERTAEIGGRTYQLPEVTASVVRELCTPMTIPSSANVDESLLVAEPKEDVSMPTVEPRDPNTQLNGPEPPQAEESGFIASVKRYCTIRHGVIAGAVVLLGTAVYLAVTRGTEVSPTA